MSKQPENPLLIYFRRQMEHFSKESHRLRDKQPLKDYKSLVGDYIFINRRLGTINHEEALQRLNDELKFAGKESKLAWKNVWRQFAQRRRAFIEADKIFKAGERESTQLLAELKKSHLDTDHLSEDYCQSMRAALDAAQATEVMWADFQKDRWKEAWLLLWVDLAIYSTYIRYFLFRIFFFSFATHSSL